MERYNSYKDSGVKWLGKIPRHWEVKPIKRIVDTYPGATPNTSNENNWDGNIPWITPADFKTDSKYVKSGARSITQTGLNSCSAKLVPVGSIVFSKRAPIGQLSITKQPLSTNQGCISCVPHAGINTDFVFYLLSIYKDTFESFSGGTTFKEISLQTFNDFRIAIPSLSEQSAIAAYLDTATAKIDAAIAQQQKMIDLLNERKQIIINRAVTKGLNSNAKMKDSGVEWIGEVPCHWECRKLKSICANTQYSIKTGPFGSQLKGDDIQEFGDVPIYNQRVVIDNDCYLFNSYVSKAKADALKSFVVKSKDLLITTRGTIGKSTIVPNDALEGILHPCIIAIRLNFDLCWNEYLQFFFQSIAFNTDMTLKSNATTIEVIYSYNLKECFVPIPPIDEQKHIVEYLNEELSKINQTIAATTNQISLLQERKQIIINEVVTGKVKVV